MTRVPLSRTAAEKRARGAQISFAVLGLGALAMVTLALPRITAVPSLDEVRPPPVAAAVPSGSGDKPVEKVAINSEGISDRFMQFANRPEAPKEETSDEDIKPDEPVEPTAPVEATRFLGVIREPGGLLAMVYAGGKQRIMGEGEEAAGVKVVSIASDAITVSEGGVEKRIEKSVRSGSSVSMVGGPDAGNGAMPQGGRVENFGQQTPARLDPDAAGTEGRPDNAAQILQQMRARKQKSNLANIPSIGGRTREGRSGSGN